MAWLSHHLSAVLAYLLWVAFGLFVRLISRPEPRDPVVARWTLIGAIGFLAVGLVVVCATVAQPVRRPSKGFPGGHVH